MSLSPYLYSYIQIRSGIKIIASRIDKNFCPYCIDPLMLVILLFVIPDIHKRNKRQGPTYGIRETSQVGSNLNLLRHCQCVSAGRFNCSRGRSQSLCPEPIQISITLSQNIFINLYQYWKNGLYNVFFLIQNHVKLFKINIFFAFYNI